MQHLFIILSRAVEGMPAIALGASLVWGVLSILLSPCHLASIPLIIGFIAGQQDMDTRRAFSMSSVFSLGILVTIALIGVVTTALGRMAGNLGGGVDYFVALVFFLVGLHLLGVIPLPFSGPGRIGMQRKGLFASFVLGLIFGVALGPCTFAFMAPVLTATFKVAAAAPLYAAGLLLAYGVGHCAVIVLAGTSAEKVQEYLNWNEASGGMQTVRRICGILVLLGGLYMVYKA